MRRTFVAILTVSLIATVLTSCHSSQELLSPELYRYTKQKGNIKFMDGVTVGGGGNQMAVTSRKPSPLQPATPNVSEEILSKYSTMMGLFPKEMTNYILYQFIDDWYGVRYRYGGTDKSGIDCSAFVQRLYEQVYNTEVVRTARNQFHSCRMVWDLDKLQEGDLVFFKTRGKHISHVGIYLYNNYFVHASSSSGVMISNLADSYWQRKFAGAGKMNIQKEPKQVL